MKEHEIAHFIDWKLVQSRVWGRGCTRFPGHEQQRLELSQAIHTSLFGVGGPSSGPPPPPHLQWMGEPTCELISALG